MPADTERSPSVLQDRCIWVFDLDNTLYPAECDLFAEIDQRMTDFVARFLRLPRDEARAVQKQYYAEHGTTLNGLMSMHGMPPDEFLAHVHEIDLSPLPKTPDLASAIAALPGHKYVYTNGSRGHATRVTDHMGLGDVFDGQFAIEDSQFVPKPNLASYQAFLEQFDLDASQAVFFEDMARNLLPAKEMGFATVLVQSDKDWSHEPASARPAGIGDDLPPHIDYVTRDLTQFVRAVVQ